MDRKALPAPLSRRPLASGSRVGPRDVRIHLSMEGENSERGGGKKAAKLIIRSVGKIAAMSASESGYVSDAQTRCAGHTECLSMYSETSSCL